MSRRTVVLTSLAGVLAVTIAVANREVTTKQGVNFEVSTHRLPLYLKTLEFVDRSAQYRQIAAEITRGSASDQDRALKVFDWTSRHIRPTPDGWPVVDDHILNIIIRGHGMSDQCADVFAMLLTSAGVPAFWHKVRAPDTGDGLILTFVHVDGRWVVMDVANGFLLRNARGELATAEDLAANQALLPDAARSLILGSTPYPRFFNELRTPPIPRPSRAELQMVWPRLWYEMTHAAGREHDESER